MPTISQLPSTNAASAADDIPISQSGIARAITVGALLASTQPAIVVDSPSLIGRTSLGSGGPEQINVGLGIGLSNGTLIANGLDHAAFPEASSLSTKSAVVISDQGNPMLMDASLLRGLFSAGQNIAIDSNGVISTLATGTTSGTLEAGNLISKFPVVDGLSGQDLVAISQAGSDYAIEYSNLLGGITIDEAQSAGPVGDVDKLWVAQGSNVMASQTFGAIWTWLANKLSTYQTSVVELTVNTTLNTILHSNRFLICSQPITLLPSVDNMGSGFQCNVINASGGSVTLGLGFVSSSGSLVLNPWQSAMLSCIVYSGGSVAFAAMPTVASVTILPGQTSGLSSVGATTTTISVSWNPPSTGGVALSYLIQYRLTGTTPWTSSLPIINATTYQITGLQPATSYDVVVEAQNAAGVGSASVILALTTKSLLQLIAPSPVTGLQASATSSSTILVSWTLQTGTNAAISYTIQYKLSSSSDWTSSNTGITGVSSTISGLQAGTSYDFSVVGINSAGMAPASASATAITQAAPSTVSSIKWNLSPSGIYTHGSGTIGVNAQVLPAASPVQFGFSLSSTIPPSIWTPAVLVNSNIWGAYAPTPTTAGTWYAWAEGLDGSAPTVSQSPFVVQ